MVVVPGSKCIHFVREYYLVPLVLVPLIDYYLVVLD